MGFLDDVADGTDSDLPQEVDDKRADAVLALFRLAKNARLHALGNQAVLSCAEQAEGILRELSALVGGNASATFADDTVLVCGRIVRSSRGTYESAMELGRMLEQRGVSEVSIEPEVTKADLLRFAGLLAGSLGGARDAGLAEAAIPHIRCRKVDPILRRADRPGSMPVADRALEMYASSLVALRRYFDRVASGAQVPTHTVKRIAQCLVSLAELRSPALLALIATTNVRRDDPARALHAAILATLIGIQIGADRGTTVRLGSVALAADVGRVAFAGTSGRDRLVPLSDRAEEAVPAMAASTAIVAWGVSTAAARRAAIAFETSWLERTSILGPLYGGARPPLPETLVLYCVRRFVDAMAPRDTSRALAAPAALQRLASDPLVDPVVLHALVRAIGILPVGTVVELETGAWAVVVVPAGAKPARRARLRIVVDADGRSTMGQADVVVGVGDGARIARVVPPEQASFDVSGPLLGLGPPA